MSEDGWGATIGLMVVIGGGYWLYNHYEIKERKTDAPKVEIQTHVLSAPRPTGMVTLRTDKDGSVWKVDADSVRGPRKSRQGWVVIDATNDKTASYRESRSLYLADCDTTASRELSLATYDKTGKTLTGKSWAPDKAEIEYFPPRTFGGAVVTFLCDTRFDAPARLAT